jgi:hypothetical protein
MTQLINKQALIAGCALASLLVAGAVNAQQADQAQTDSSDAQSAESTFTPDFTADRGNPLRFGSVRVYPRMAVRFGSDNNVTQVPDGQPKRDENFWLYSPEVFADYISGGQKYEFGYIGAFRKNENSKADDTDSNALRLAGDNTITTRNRLSWSARYTEAQEEVGDNDLTTATPKRNT